VCKNTPNVASFSFLNDIVFVNILTCHIIIYYCVFNNVSHTEILYLRTYYINNLVIFWISASFLHFWRLIVHLFFAGVKLTHNPNAASYIKGTLINLLNKYSEMYSVVKITCLEDSRCEECFGLKNRNGHCSGKILNEGITMCLKIN